MDRTTGTVSLAGGGHLYYETWGAGPAVVLVPGLGGLGSFWNSVADALSGDFQVVIHDHRGTGQSSIERIEYSVQQMSADVLALLDALALEQVSLIGHSTGGAIGQTLALEHSDRLTNLVLSSTWTAADAYFRRLFAVRKRILQTGGALHYLESVPLLMSPPAYVRDNAPPSLSEAEALAQIPDPEVVCRRIDAIVAFNRAEELGAINCPTLVSCARDDIITPFYYSEALLGAIPGATSAFVDAGGHFYPATHPELFLNGVLPFLQEKR